MRGQLVSHPVIAGVTPPLVPPGGPLLDQSEAALYLHKSVRWMRRALSERTVPAIKVGKSVFVRRADLDALIGSGYGLPPTAAPRRRVWSASARGQANALRRSQTRSKGQSRGHR